jgi:predicted ribosome quality control (RQC) complex YloA/Tae2 family protein
MSGTGPVSGSLNWKEIDLVLSELSLTHSLIQEVHQPAHDRIVLQLFREGEHFSLLVSLSPRFPRMHLLREKLANPAKPPRFASLLRAHIRGGRIGSAAQVRKADGTEGERIVSLSVLRGGELKILWVRLWGAAANAILTDNEGMIIDAMYRRPKKGEISGQLFQPLAAAGRAAAGRAAPGRAAPASPKEYSIRSLPGEGSFNEKLEAYFREWETHGDLQRLAAQAEAELEMGENKVLANLEKLQTRLAEYSNLERFK